MKDIMGMMKKAQEMQAKMAALQDELETLEVEGAAGGGMVRSSMTAKGELKAVKIDPTLMKADEKEILEDLIVAALNDARAKAEPSAGQDVRASPPACRSRPA